MSEITDDGEDLNNTEGNIRRIDKLPPSELGEGGPAVVFDVPDDLTYDDMNITDVLWPGSKIMIWYEPPDFDYDYLALKTEVEDGEIVVVDYPAGVMSAEEVYETHPDAPHAENLRPIYDWLKSEGVRFDG